MRGDRVGQLAGVVDPHRGDHRVVVQAVRQLHVPLEQRHNMPHRLLNVVAGVVLLGQQLRHDTIEPLVFLPLDRAGAVEPFDQHFDVAVRQLQTLHDVGDTAHRVDILRLRVVGGGVLLRCEEDPLVFRQRVFERACRRRSSDDERHHYVRKHDDVAEWDNREGFVDFHKGAERTVRLSGLFNDSDRLFL